MFFYILAGHRVILTVNKKIFIGLIHGDTEFAVDVILDFIIVPVEMILSNVNSTWYALESMRKPTILILGGVDKGNDYRMLLDLVKEKVKAIVCLGVDNTKIHEAFRNDVQTIVDTSSAEEAVNAAFNIASPGDVVLLSPACASFDLFNNYEDRGDQFKKAVRGL